MTNDYYVYTHSRPDGRVFYIGKGRKNRAFTFTKRNKHHRAICEKYGIENIRVSFIIENLTEQESFDAEILWINFIGVESLSNMTLGGEGCSGRTPTMEHRIAVSIATKNRMADPEYKQRRVSILKDWSSDPEKLAERGRRIKKTKCTSEGRAINSAAVKSAMASPEFRKRRSELSKAMWSNPVVRQERREHTAHLWSDPEFKAKQLALMQNSPNRAESRLRQAEKMRILHQDPVYKAKISAAIRAAKNK